jgi:hypothetical protein
MSQSDAEQPTSCFEVLFDDHRQEPLKLPQLHLVSLRNMEIRRPVWRGGAAVSVRPRGAEGLDLQAGRAGLVVGLDVNVGKGPHHWADRSWLYDVAGGAGTGDEIAERHTGGEGEADGQSERDGD